MERQQEPWIKRIEINAERVTELNIKDTVNTVK